MKQTILCSHSRHFCKDGLVVDKRQFGRRRDGNTLSFIVLHRTTRAFELCVEVITFFILFIFYFFTKQSKVKEHFQPDHRAGIIEYNACYISISEKSHSSTRKRRHKVSRRPRHRVIYDPKPSHLHAYNKNTNSLRRSRLLGAKGRENRHRAFSCPASDAALLEHAAWDRLRKKEGTR